MEEAITGDFALIKAWKADKETFYDDCLEGFFRGVVQGIT